MAKLTYDEILKGCIEGIKNAYSEYDSWNGWQWLWEAPEYLLTVNIAKAISKIDKPKFITLEDNVKQTLKDANAKIKGPLKKSIRGSGRSDIVLWWGGGTPRGIIEVKNGVYSIEHIIKDINRILGILEKDSNIELGVISFYMYGYYKSKNPLETLMKRVKTIFKEVKEIGDNNKYKLKKRVEEIVHDDETAELAVAIMLHK